MDAKTVLHTSCDQNLPEGIAKPNNSESFCSLQCSGSASGTVCHLAHVTHVPVATLCVKMNGPVFFYNVDIGICNRKWYDHTTLSNQVSHRDLHSLKRHAHFDDIQSCDPYMNICFCERSTFKSWLEMQSRINDTTVRIMMQDLWQVNVQRNTE